MGAFPLPVLGFESDPHGPVLLLFTFAECYLTLQVLPELSCSAPAIYFHLSLILSILIPQHIDLYFCIEEGWILLLFPLRKNCLFQTDPVWPRVHMQMQDIWGTFLDLSLWSPFYCHPDHSLACHLAKFTKTSFIYTRQEVMQASVSFLWHPPIVTMPVLSSAGSQSYPNS